MTEWIVTSSAMILIIIALRGLLKGKISLKLQYGLWALVLVRLLLPFSIVDSAMSISNLLSAPVIQEADEAVADYESAYDNALQRYESSGAEYTDTEIRQQVQQELYDREYSRIEKEYAQSATPVPEIQIQTEAQQQVEVISLTAVITEALPYLWILGMMVAAVALIGSNLHFGWKLRKSRTPLEIPGVPLKVYLTDYVATPCLFGAVKPDIYLTGEVMTDSQMRRHVIAHETSHYRQGDHIWSMLRCVCLVLHWYNPLVWAAAVLSKQDAELACDEATIKVLGEAERVAYGRTLIGMTCVRRDPRSLMLTATTMLGTKKTLKERVMLIAKKPKTALYTLIACILVVSLAVGCTFTGAPARTEEEKLLDRCREAVEYIQNLEHFEITEHYELVEESDYVVGPNTQEARYIHSGDDWYHFKSYVDWTWQFLEKDGQQYRKDITNAVPVEDIPAIEWTQVDLSENYYAKHAWIMDIHWDEDSIGFLTYTGNGDGYEGGSLTPVSVTSDTDGDADLISVVFEPGTEQIYNPEDAEGTSWIITIRFDRETGNVTEVTREIVMEDREMTVNGETVKANFRSTSTLSINSGTEEEMSAIINGIYFDEIVTVVPTPEDPTEPSAAENWDMNAVLVNDKGEVIESLELTADVRIWEQEGRGYYSLNFNYPENIGNSGGGPLPYPESESNYSSCFGVRNETGPDGKRVGTYYVAFDPEMESFIVDFVDDKDVFLIAYRSSDADVSALWVHFRDFISTRLPEQTDSNVSNIDLNLTGMVVDADGNIKNHLQKNITVTIQGTRTDKAAGYDELELDITFSDNYRYVIGHLPTVSYSSDSDYILLDYDVCMGIGYDGVSETSKSVMFAMSTDREYLILEWEGDEGEYLVASADPDITPAEIMEYFREYLDKFSYSRPENTETEPTTKPTEPNQEVARFQELLTSQNGYWYWRAMGCIFEEPEELSLYYLFYNGLPHDERQDRDTYTDSEVEFLKGIARNSSWQDETAWVNAQKMPKQYISDVLANYFGLTLEDVTIPEEWTYFEDTDSYYYMRSDAYGVANPTVTDVEKRDNGIVYVYWTTPNHIMDTRDRKIYKFLENPQMLMVLRENEDGSYRVIMNLSTTEPTVPPTEPPTVPPAEPLYEPTVDPMTGILEILFSAEKLEAGVRVGDEAKSTYGVSAEMEQPLLDLLSGYDRNRVTDNDFEESNAVLEIYSSTKRDGIQFIDYRLQLRAIEDGNFLLRWDYRNMPEYYLLTPPEGGNSMRDLVGFISEYFPSYDLPGPKK